MKKLSLLILALFMLANLAFAENELPLETVHGDSYSLTLPEGLSVMKDTEPFTAAAIVDYGDIASIGFIACDPAVIRLITMMSIDSDESADLAASNASEILLGSNDTVVQVPCGNNLPSAFSCSIDGVNYDFYYISAAGKLYCFTCAGLTDDEITQMLSSFSAE